MKKIFSLMICGVLILILSGCGANKNEFDIGKKSDVEISQRNVKLSIKDGTLTKTGATIILKNDSDIDVEYGNPYNIEIKKNNEWHKINVEVFFTLPAFILKPGESKEIDLTWKETYGSLANGEYRIIKSINVEKEDGTFESFYVSAEFTIE